MPEVQRSCLWQKETFFMVRLNVLWEKPVAFFWDKLLGKAAVAIMDGGIEMGSEYPPSSLAKRAENID